jgi:hypothetical protein
MVKPNMAELYPFYEKLFSRYFANERFASSLGMSLASYIVSSDLHLGVNNSMIWAWVELLINLYSRPNYRSYFLTFMFRPIGPISPSINDKRPLAWLKPRRVLSILDHEILEFHKRLVLRANRNPQKPRFRHLIPDLIAVPDAGAKAKLKNRAIGSNWFQDEAHSKPLLSHVIPNDGLHFHGWAYFHTENRFRGDFQTHFANKHSDYINGMKYLQRVHLKEITHDPKIVALYLIAPLVHWSFTPDDVIVLGPR